MTPANEAASGAQQTPEPSRSSPPPGRGRRRIRSILLWVAVLIAVIAAIISFVPGPAARLVLHYYLDDLGIDVDGEKTLDVNLWKGLITFGPAHFRLGDADPGQVTKLGLDFSVRGLFGRRAIVTTLIIEGLKVKMTQAADGELALNGVPLSGLIASKEEAAETKEKGGWGAGLDSFELRDSTLTFVTSQDRQAELDIDSLSLIGFRTWQPEEPGTFALAGRLNGMPVSAEGEAWPFADEVHLGLQYRIDDIELTKIEQFAGPLGLERNAGRLDLQGAGEITQLLKGGTSIASTGELKAEGVDVSLPKTVAVGMTEASGKFEQRTQLDPDGALKTAGSITVDAASGRVQAADGPTVTFDRASLPATDVGLSLSSDGNLDFRAAPTLDVSKLAMSGPTSLSSTSVRIQFSDLGVTSAAAGSNVEANGTATVTDLTVETPAAGGSGGFKLRSPGVEAALSDIAVTQDKDRTRVSGKAIAKPGAISLSLPPASPGEASISAELDTSNLSFENISLDINAGGVALTGKAATEIAAAELTLPTGPGAPPVVATLKQLALTVRELALTTAGNETRLQASASANIGELAAGNDRQVQAAPQRGRRASAVAATPRSRVSAGPIGIDVSRLELTQRPEVLQVTTTLTSQWNQVQGALRDLPGQPKLSLADLKLTTAPLSVAVAEKGVRVTGGTAIALTGAEASWQSQLAASRGAKVGSEANAARLAVDMSRLDLRTGGGAVSANAAVTVDGSEIKLRSAEADTIAGGQIAVGRLKSTVKEISAGRPPAPAWRVVLDATLGNLATGKPNVVPHMRAESFEVRDLVLDDRGAVDAGALIFEKTDAAISRRWIERLGGDPAAEKVVQTAEEVVEKAKKENAPLRIGQLRVENGANINFEDDVLKPPARFALKIEALDMGELNTAKPEGRTDLFLRARLNEFTPIQAQGWASPLAAKPDFALNASVKYLQLPQLSPYTAQAIGINIDSGRLRINADATAQRGELQGVINLAANSLALAPVSAAVANQAENRIGVPINTALALLEDDEGKIALSIPLSGNLASPSFDLGDAIGLAMTNVVKGAVLAPFRLALLPLNLLVGAASGSTPKLAPITFDPNTETPDAQGKTVVASLTKLLQDEPKLSVQVCGRATLQDRAAALVKEALPDERDPIYPVAVADLRAGLGQLAQTRTTVVRRALTDETGIRRGRVLECRSEYNDQDNGSPRVEIKF